ncbi:threonine/serine exporter [Romboutsia sp. CE17]|uniref:threonine/serine exporter family protein n=1 Tax=Romboutsia sp. CE17 TaxID=2724150 RepID=UPI001442C777|nr:threonine/serine exporter family protein [Romboutsia sp. CE17]QJA07768.1 threonine/serine exporter [Romboutsia sp. CE17]
MFIEIIMSFFAAFSFGILFNVKGKYLYVAGFGGSLGWFVYKACLTSGIGGSSSLFLSAVVFSIYCEMCARIYMTPTTILSVCCLIPLVPGYGVYNTLYECLKGNYIKAFDIGTTTLGSAGALALGVILVSTLFRNFNLHKLIKIIK